MSLLLTDGDEKPAAGSEYVGYIEGDQTVTVRK